MVRRACRRHRAPRRGPDGRACRRHPGRPDGHRGDGRRTAPIHWFDCHPSHRVRCGYVTVPLDRQDNSMGTIDIYFELYLHSDTSAAGPGADRRRGGRPRLLHDREPLVLQGPVPADARAPRPAAGRPARHRTLGSDRLQAPAALHGELRPRRREVRSSARRRLRPVREPQRRRRHGRRAGRPSGSARSTSTATPTERSSARPSRCGTPTWCAPSSSTRRTSSSGPTRGTATRTRPW